MEERNEEKLTSSGVQGEPVQESELTEGVSDEERRELVPDLLARRFASDPRSYWQIVWADFKTNSWAHGALWVMIVMALLAVFSPMLANQRPFVLYLPQDVALPAGNTSVEHGWQFPLFASLRFSDWFLLFGFLTFTSAIVLYRRAGKRRMEASKTSAIVLGVLGLLPAVLAMMSSPALRQWRAGEFGPEQAGMFLGAQTGWWIFYGIIAAVGLYMLSRGVLNLWRNKVDEFGNFTTGSSITKSVTGALLICAGAAFVGTLGQRQLETTDYYALAQHEDAFAIFPPVQQDFLASDPYVKNQQPLGPYLTVQPSGGSQAAIDLGLTENRRDSDLALENMYPEDPLEPADDEGADMRRPLSPDTPLAALRDGQGVRQHDSPMRDFTIVAKNLERFGVSLYGALTIGDVLAEITDATGGAVEAQLSETGGSIVLQDTTEKRPTFYLGTDPAGSDVASRLIHATRVALSIGFVSTGIALLIGIVMGALMGYFGGWVDIVGMRTIEIFMAIPRLFLLLTIIAFIPPQWNEYMLYAMMAVIGATSWMNAARFIRAEFFKLRNQDFIQAAKAAGLPLRSVLFKHMLPNGVTPVLVDASFGVAAAIFIETGLSFLGFGIKPPNPSWGKMLSEAVDPSTGVFHWWMAIFPGIMIFLTVFAFNLIGDALRDAIDPKLKKAAN